MWVDDVPRMRMDISEEPALFHMDITGLKNEVWNRE